MDGKTAAIQWPHDGCPYVWGPRTSPTAIGFLVYSLTRNDIPGPGLIERWYVGTARSIGNVRSQKSEAGHGLLGKLPLRAT